MFYLGAELGADLPIIALLFAVLVASVYLMSTSSGSGSTLSVQMSK